MFIAGLGQVQKIHSGFSSIDSQSESIRMGDVTPIQLDVSI